MEFEGSRTPLGLVATLAPAHVTTALRASVGLPPGGDLTGPGGETFPCAGAYQ